MRLIRGDQLSPETRRDVLSAYGYRWTVENLIRARQWFGQSGTPTMQPTTDAEWLASHAFHVTKSGQLSLKHRHCEPAFMAKVA